jgi:hypothetical protein
MLPCYLWYHGSDSNTAILDVGDDVSVYNLRRKHDEPKKTENHLKKTDCPATKTSQESLASALRPSSMAPSILASTDEQLPASLFAAPRAYKCGTAVVVHWLSTFQNSSSIDRIKGPLISRIVTVTQLLERAQVATKLRVTPPSKCTMRFESPWSIVTRPQNTTTILLQRPGLLRQQLRRHVTSSSTKC